MRARSLFVVLLAAAGACADGDQVTIVHKTLALEQEHTLLVDRTMEYIILFIPNAEQSEFPMRVWFLSDAADVAHPLLLTARQRTGAVTWQLPVAAQTPLLELERTLCPDDADADAGADCAGEGEGEERRGELVLHVASSCAARATLRLRVAPARDWRIRDKLQVRASLAAPHVSRFQFAAEQASVRLVVSSSDDVCATVAVHPSSCPIAQTQSEIEQASARMTVLRSGAVQLSKARYPRGFYVIALVGESDAACTGEEEEEEPPAWLWDSLEQTHAPPPARARVKQLTYEIKETLTRREYVVGVVATLALFLSFYVAFGALVLAERWPRWYSCVAPRAVLADTHTATFDSSDASDTDSEEAASDAAAASPAPAPEGPANGRVAAEEPQLEAGAARADAGDGQGAVTGAGAGAGARPFGLPAELRVAALARRRSRVLGARSQRYLYTLYTVAVFYALPVLQFVVAFQVVLNVSGSLDLCYYNFLCAHPVGALSDFNHVLSNLGYVLLGALFMLQLRRRKRRRDLQPRDEEYGIPPHYGLLASLGAGLMVVGLLSASYHVCPNGLNFQFDTAFMYVLAVLCMVKIYQSRHPDINARAHATFGVLAVLIALVVWGVLGGGPLFWSVFTLLHVFTFLLLSLRIYYVGQFRLEKASLAAAAASLRGGGGARPLYTPRLVALLLANAVNWAFAIYGLVTQAADIASHLLFVLLCNALLYMVFYLCMKLLHGERPRWYAWLYLAGAAAAWAAALAYFTSGSTDWAAPAARSRLLNHECRVLRFYDAHDLWHMLSAVALYLTFNAMLTWDDGLAAVRRADIAVF